MARNWDADIWSGLIRIWSEMDLNEDQHRKVLGWLACSELHPKHEHEIARALLALVNNYNKPYALNLLPQANAIAIALWRNLDRDQPPEEEEKYDWFESAINHSAGVLAEFWIQGLSLWRKKQDPTPNTLSEEYCQALSDILQDPTLPGRLGRSVLASQFTFLLAADEVWTRENLLPLFEAENVADFQAAWDGFLTLGRLTPAVAELLEDAFLQAVQRIEGDLVQRKDKFINYYTTMVGYFISDPIETWIPQFFSNSGEKTKPLFTKSVRLHLQNMHEADQQGWWERWLNPYWENRLQGIPVVLEPGEIERMLDWLFYLTTVFPEAVSLAIRMPKTPLQRQCHPVVYNLRESKLLRDHPASVADLLIYLGELRLNKVSWLGGQEIIDKLLQSDLPPQLAHKLKELVAKLGLK